MINDVNDELILAARLLLATLFLIFGWRKLRDYSGTVSQIAQLGGPMPRLAAGIAIFMELPVAFAVAVRASFRFITGFIHVGDCAYWASLLDNDGCGAGRQHGWLLQESEHHGWLFAVVHYRRGKVFDRRVAQYR